MSQLIHINKTRYSTQDIEDLYAAFMVWLKAQIAANPDAQLGEGQLSRRYYSNSKPQPITLAYWSSPWDPGHMQFDKQLSYGHSAEGSIGSGPWFVKNCYPEDESENINLRTPNNATSILSPVEALASQGQMPRAMMSQLLFVVLRYAGYRVQEVQQGHTTFRYDRPLYGLTMTYCKRFVQEHSQLKVKVLKRVQHKSTPATKRQQLERLVQTFQNGSAASEVKWKVWNVRNQCDELHSAWVKNYKQLKRVLAKADECGMDKDYKQAFDAIANQRRLSKLLRQLADDHEREEQALIDMLNKDKEGK